MVQLLLAAGLVVQDLTVVQVLAAVQLVVQATTVGPGRPAAQLVVSDTTVGLDGQAAALALLATAALERQTGSPVLQDSPAPPDPPAAGRALLGHTTSTLAPPAPHVRADTIAQVIQC